MLGDVDHEISTGSKNQRVLLMEMTSRHHPFSLGHTQVLGHVQEMSHVTEISTVASMSVALPALPAP